MTARHSKIIIRSLKKFGFVKLEEKNHHQYYVYVTLAGKVLRVRTYISHGNKDYGDDLLSKVADQIKLTKKELLNLIDGNMTRKEYEDILRSKGFIK